ncbi:polysaccharide pyruvyl transferase family protein [Chryseobacterium sp. MFBS3-17]|uniref:polysaccharide pyruvyl transferase family protein n=1 Tax=Chryseobacterium sp. MFBS3-17 TaxID=2886689 RepID=UPI001D0F1678|nr:polysaccharide pyruvyl transferase family protein [Chryseobacterium sp. MFBS3-17]MCC2591356.1 polysaccharide pyruvyl transferase family protein [Chryseobacterium sp. MFBS3-17]
MIKTDILFAGFYGQRNTGDDAFVEVTSWGAKKYWNKTNNRFIAIEKNLPQTIELVKGYPLQFPKTYGFQKKLLLNNTQYLISSGGSTIHSILKPNNPKHIALELKEKGKNIKIGAIGVSVGPFKTIEDEKAVQKYLKSIDFIALRDQRSYDYVKSLETNYDPVNAFDMAALIPEIYNYSITKEKQKKIIGISVCPYESVHLGGDIANEERRNNQLIELIKVIDKNEEVEFKFFIINGNPKIGDLKITKEVINKSKPKRYTIVDYNKDTRYIWEEINRCSVVISTRLHAAIFACFGQTPFILVEYHKKCSDFLEDVGYCKEARIYDAEFDVQEKSKIVLDWCNDYSSYKTPTKLKQKFEQARLNFTDIKL